jgi:hypothetical protein
MRKACLTLKVTAMVVTVAGWGSIATSSPWCATINGTVNLQGRTNNTSFLTFQLRTPGQAIALQSYPKTVGQDGAYTMDNIVAGTYDLAVYKINYPRNYLWEVQQIVAQDGTPCTANFQLRGGDADSSNAVNIQDLNILKSSYGKMKGQPGYDERADFNGDDAVNIWDLNILKVNYGQRGAELANPDPRAPTVEITSPVGGETVSGDGTITVNVNDTLGDNPGILTTDIYVDGIRVAGGPRAQDSYTWDTRSFSNERHTMCAFAVDGDGFVAMSQLLTITTDNFISSVTCDKVQFNPNPSFEETVTISAKLSAIGVYTIDIDDLEGNVIRSFGPESGDSISITWDGRNQYGDIVSDGLYRFTIGAIYEGGGGSSSISASATGFMNKYTWGVNEAELLIVLGPNVKDYAFSRWYEMMKAVEMAAIRQGLKFAKIFTPEAKWEILKTGLSSQNSSVLWVLAHGQENPLSWPARTGFWLDDGIVFSFVDGLPPWIFVIAKEMRTVGLRDSGKMKILHFPGCWSGVYDDMARELGMYSENNSIFFDQCYVGYDDWSTPVFPYSTFSERFWDNLGDGNPVYNALWYACYGQWPYLTIPYSHTRTYGSESATLPMY